MINRKTNCVCVSPPYLFVFYFSKSSLSSDKKIVDPFASSPIVFIIYTSQLNLHNHYFYTYVSLIESYASLSDATLSIKRRYLYKIRCF